MSSGKQIEVLICVLIWSILVKYDLSCGVNTHIEIGHRALHFFNGTTSINNYTRMILEHQDAFQAGCPYPDAFYSIVCYKGVFHSVSEDTHWGEFLNAAISYIGDKYPLPWDKDTEKLVVFILGVVSHQVADVSWHSLGIDQGFIRTMSKVNFHNDYASAHTVADIGGDIVNQYELNMDYIKLFNEWYVPVEDLYQIYLKYYGSENITRNVIEDCSSILLLQRLAEKLVIGDLFPFYAEQSPFLVDMLNKYFLGGMDDMATWTRYIWKDVVYILEHGVQSCSLPHNVLFTHCNSSIHNAPKRTAKTRETNGFFAEPNLRGLGLNDISKQYVRRGVYLRPHPSVKEKIKNFNLQNTEKVRKTTKRVEGALKFERPTKQLPNFTYSTYYPYARLGWSILTKDVNADGHTDIVLGAPGAGANGNLTGMVFVMLGNGRGLLSCDKIVERDANITLVGYSENGRFGHALNVLDMNNDGRLDLAVGAPGSGSESLTYNGTVYIYYGTGNQSCPFDHNPDIVFIGQGVYFGLGWSLSVNNNSLIIGAPFASTVDKEQNGVVFNVASNTSRKGGMYSLGLKDVWLKGEQNYSWFGYSMNTAKSRFGDLLFLSAPTFKINAIENGSFSVNDTQAVGRLHIYTVKNTKATLLNTLTGLHEFDMLGSSSAFEENWNKELLVVSAPLANINGTYYNISLPLNQAGTVQLYNMSSLLYAKQSTLPVSQFFGNRMFSRFGHNVLLIDVNNDGYADLVISASLQTSNLLDDFTKVERGEIFIFLSKNGSYPSGNSTVSHCPMESPLIPCTSYVANRTLSIPESQGKLGSSLSFSHIAGKKYILAGSPHSNKRARLSGTISFYSV